MDGWLGLSECPQQMRHQHQLPAKYLFTKTIAILIWVGMTCSGTEFSQEINRLTFVNPWLLHSVSKRNWCLYTSRAAQWSWYVFLRKLISDVRKCTAAAAVCGERRYLLHMLWRQLFENRVIESTESRWWWWRHSQASVKGLLTVLRACDPTHRWRRKVCFGRYG